jgi:hypothetical protein
MFIETNKFFYWKLLNIKNIVLKPRGVDLSNCKLSKIEDQLNYKEAVKYFIDLQNFIGLIEKNNLTLTYVDENDFLIVDGNIILINDNCIIDFNKDNYFTIDKILKPKKYIPPEFKYEFPLNLYKSFCYYQLCSMIKNKLLLSLDNIKHTPLYYSINRGLHLEPNKRFLIII